MRAGRRDGGAPGSSGRGARSHANHPQPTTRCTRAGPGWLSGSAAAEPTPGGPRGWTPGARQKGQSHGRGRAPGPAARALAHCRPPPTGGGHARMLRDRTTRPTHSSGKKVSQSLRDNSVSVGRVGSSPCTGALVLRPQPGADSGLAADAGECPGLAPGTCKAQSRPRLPPHGAALGARVAGSQTSAETGNLRAGAELSQLSALITQTCLLTPVIILTLLLIVA